MSRQRLSWDKEADLSKKADPYTMNQDRKNPPVEKYRTGDPSAWAEDPHMAHPWESEKRTETGHPAPAREAVKAARKLEDRAIKCITIAQRMLPGASDDVIEEQATDLMFMPEQSILSTLQRQASLAETLTAGDKDEEAEEKEEKEEKPEEMKEAAKKEEKPEDKKEELPPVEAKKEEKPEEKKEELPPVEAKKEEKPEEKKEELPPVEAKKEEKEEKKEEEAPEEPIMASDLLDKIFAAEEIVPEKSGAKKLSGIVKKASGSDPLDSIWDAPPDVSKVFGGK